MAITTFTVSKAAGWASTDVILQLEEAFTRLSWHGTTQTGIVTSISAWSGGGTVGSSNTDYYDVFPTSTSGIGTGASFWVDRSGGPVSRILVNRPGVGYTDGEVVQLSAADIGGSANGATGIAVTVKVAGNASPVGYGTTTAFYSKDVTAGSSTPWGVLRHPIQANKKFGSTYRGFQVYSTTYLYQRTGSSFHPYTVTNNSDKGNGYATRFAGNTGFEMYSTIDSGQDNYTTSTTLSYAQFSSTFASSNSYQLDLNVFRSGLDPNFAVFSFRHPTLSSTTLSGNTYLTFIIHNFTTSLWDLDYLFLGGTTVISPSSGNSTNPRLEFTTYCDGTGTFSKRTAEFGYLNYYNQTYKKTTYPSNALGQNNTSEYMGIYLRNSSTSRGSGGYSSQEYLPSATNFNAVIKGIPLNAMLAPCPYYIPDDFVLIDFDYASPSANIQQGDTITISGSEVYTVIQGSYNQDTRTRGILFCARTV